MRCFFLLLMSSILLCAELLAQTRIVSGKITDANGNPIPNASVVIRGTKSGTTTNNDGMYSLNVPGNARILVISSIGLTEQAISIGSNTTINASLQNTDQSLTEVVVTSFGIRRDRKTLGYSVPVIKADELTAVKNTNISNALVGKVAGVRVQGSGGSFTGSNILIRGYTSVTGSNQPLYVVDGIPIDNSGGGTLLQNGTTTTNRAVDINPEDIENLTVLKGAAATSLYGSRAAGGAILITTKKGRKGTKNAIEVSSSYNVVQSNRLPEYQNLYAQGVAGAYNNRSAQSWGPEIKGQTVTNFFGQPEQLQAFPDNVKDITENGYNLQNNISFSGGSDKTTYRVSYGNTNETFIVRNNQLRRNNLTLNLNSDVTSKLTVGSFINFSNTSSRRTQQGNQLSNPFFRSLFTPRSYDLTNQPYYDAAGNQLYYGGEDNPYWSIENVKYKDEVNRLFGNLNLKYAFTDWLNADLKVGSDFFAFRSNGFDEIGARGGGNTSAQATGGVREIRNTTRNLNSYLTLNASKAFGNFNVSATVGNEIVDNFLTTSNVRGVGLTVKGFNQMSNAKTYTPTYGSSRSRTIGAFGDLVLDYKNFLSINLKARNDFVSTLPANNRSIFYPAAAVSFVLTEAFPALKSDFINNIKLRANMGKVGRGPGAYNTDNYLATANPDDGFGPNIQFPFNGLLAYTIGNGAGNPELKPEFTTEWEIGTDINLWNNRIIIEANYYERKTTEGLFAVPYSGASGITSVFQNAGELETKGLELGLVLSPVKTTNFNWTISGNFTQFNSKVKKLAPGVPLIFLAGFTTPNVRLVAGEEYGSIYGNKYNRDEQGRLILNASGLPTATTDVFKIGNPNPAWTMGITNAFNYKGFELTVLFDIKQGGDIYSRNIADLRRNGVVVETAEFSRFEKDGTTLAKPYQFQGVNAAGAPVNVPITAEQYWGNNGKYAAAEGFILNTSWFRVREATLSYRIPKTLTDKTPFGNVDFGLFGRNIFLKAKNFPHLDPEQNVLGISNAQGLEFNAQPSTRSMGLNLRFTL